MLVLRRSADLTGDKAILLVINYFWIDRERERSGVILMQFLPFADPKALALCDAFERGVYQL
jgi:hypothetical protein